MSTYAMKLALELFEQFGRDSRLKYEHQAIYKTIVALNTPQQRTAEQSSRTLAWVGLTIDEISYEFYKYESAGAWYQFACAIEKKLKEKNT